MRREPTESHVSTSTGPTTLQERRRPQLDALRGMAVTAVMVSHFSPTVQVGIQISHGIYLLHNFSHRWDTRIMRQITRNRHSYLESEVLQCSFWLRFPSGRRPSVGTRLNSRLVDEKLD